MPNHITNRIYLEPTDKDVWIDDVIEPIHEYMKEKGEKKEDEDRSDFDFNNLIPMPKELQGSTSPAKIVSEEEYEDLVKKAKEEHKKNPHWGLSLPITQKMSDELTAKYGANNWYDWSVANWGTKWNAYDIEITDSGWKFDTAWSTPMQVVEALSRRFKDFYFKVVWADEGGGGGYYEYFEGNLINEDYAGGRDETITIDARIFERLVKGW